jgi:hypothetical protein
LSAPRKGSGNKDQQLTTAQAQATPPHQRSGSHAIMDDETSDESGTDISSPELRRPEFGRDEVKRMLAERRAEREGNPFVCFWNLASHQSIVQI